MVVVCVLLEWIGNFIVWLFELLVLFDVKVG